MREIEMKAGAVEARRKFRFTQPRVTEFNPGGIALQAASQYGAQEAASGDEAVSMAVEPELSGALDFARGQRGL